MSETKHTPGPWRWEVNNKGRRISLCGGKNPFDLIVVDFVRWGMNSAAPRFRTGGDDLNVMKHAADFCVPVAGREHHASWFQDLSHPDAKLIAAAPDLLAIARAVVAGGMSYPKHLRDQAAEAIAKAEGETI
jgi:hypothetical protein